MAITLAASVEFFLGSQNKLPISPGYLEAWVSTLDKNVKTLFISSATLKDVILPAYNLMKPKVSAFEVNMWKVDKKGNMKTTKHPQISTSLRAEDGVPVALISENPELQSFAEYIQKIPEDIAYIVAVVELPDNYNYSLIVELATRKVEVVACVLDKVDESVARPLENAIVWLCMYKYHKRLNAINVIRRTKPPYVYCTVLTMFYTMLRILRKYSLKEVVHWIDVGNMIAFLNQINNKNMSLQLIRK